MAHSTSTKSSKKLLWEKIKGIRVAMMTTEEPDGGLCSRPMAAQEVEFDGNLWFFTLATAPKVGQVEQHRQVNISYAKPSDHMYVSVSGTAELVRDRKQIHEHWKPFYKAWFPNGEDETDLALLKVHVESAEYWDVSSAGGLSSAVKALFARPKDEIERDVKLDMQ